MKAVSAIIVIILVLLISVFLASLAYMFFSGILTSTTTTTGESVSRTARSLTGKLLIENINPEGKITIRNTGSIALSSFKVYANDIEVASDDGIMEPGSVLSKDLILEEGTYDFYVTSDYAVSLHKIGRIGGSIIFMFQENADETNCGGGTHNNLVDGDWDTYEIEVKNPDAYMNYTKPSGSTGAIWQIKDFPGTKNFTIPDECWNYNANKLLLDVYSNDNEPSVNFYCYNTSSEWHPVYINDTRTSCESSYLYEEGVWWKISSSRTEYQENADETEFTGNVIDGDWGTYADMGCCEWYINYSKPSDTSGSIYRVKDSAGEENLIVPSSCWVYYSNIIRLKMIWGDGTGSQSWLCYDGDWVAMRYNDGFSNNYIYEEAMWWIKT